MVCSQLEPPEWACNLLEQLGAARPGRGAVISCFTCSPDDWQRSALMEDVRSLWHTKCKLSDSLELVYQFKGTSN